MTQKTPNHEGGSVDATETPTPTHEIIGRSEHDQLSDRFDFVQHIWVRINNPYGRDVIAKHTYKADPTPEYQDEYDNDAIYRYVQWVWPDYNPAQGDHSFLDSPLEGFTFDVEGSNRERKVEFCEANATHDPTMELAIIYNRVHDSIQDQLSLPDDIISLT